MKRSLTDSDIDAVSAVIVEAAQLEILPRFRLLEAHDIAEKSPGEMVTVADREAERRIVDGLLKILPDAYVIGEESEQESPQHGAEDMPIWVVDPLDGTTAFIDGDPEFAVMVGLIQGRETVAAWVHSPVACWTAVAQRGAGAFLDGTSLRTACVTTLAEVAGSVRNRFLPDDLREQVTRAIPGFRHVALNGSSALDHVAVASGQRQFSLYYRTLVWDHAPGCLLVQEAGGQVARLDGAPYMPLDGRAGLLTACDQQAWLDVHAALMPEVHLSSRDDAVGWRQPDIS